MRKRVITLLVLAACCSRSASSDIIRINENRCWEDLRSADGVRGSAIIYYYPDVTTFASNTECPQRSMLLSIDEKSAEKLHRVFDLVKKDRENAIGISFSAEVAGSIYRVRGHEQNYIRVSYISISPTKRPKVI